MVSLDVQSISMGFKSDLEDFREFKEVLSDVSRVSCGTVKGFWIISGTFRAFQRASLIYQKLSQNVPPRKLGLYVRFRGFLSTSGCLGHLLLECGV